MALGRDGDCVMPFQTEVTPFTGDNDLADFLTNVWLPFARDDVGWADNQAPTLSPEVVSPEAEIWTHRVLRAGSPGAPVSPFTRLEPFIFLRTNEAGTDLNIFTGTDVDDTQEGYDQPGNPMNAPVDVDYVGNGKTGRCLQMNALEGVFQAYWMFAPADGTYIHTVLKISSRHYRHFHVGKLVPLHPDLDSRAFYVTAHWWDQVGTDQKTMHITGAPPANGEHSPYSDEHRLPFQVHGAGNELDSSAAQRMQTKGNIFYMPGLAQNSPEIEWYHAAPGDDLDWLAHMGVANIRKHIGDVNADNNSVIFGIAQISGWGPGLGSILFMCDRTFTSNAVPLVPIYVSANVDFASLNRQGVVAQIPDVFRINVANIAAEQEITVGSDTYVVFPLANKDSANVLSAEPYSGYEGLAYKKVTGALET